MERTVTNCKTVSLEQNITFLLLLNLVYRMCRRNRYWTTNNNHDKLDQESTLIQLQSKLNHFSILPLKFIFGNN